MKKIFQLTVWACCMVMPFYGIADEKGTLQQVYHGDTIVAQAETYKYTWIGTRNNGVFMIKKRNGKVCHLTAQNSKLPSNNISSIAALSNGGVYIGTDEGILRYDNYTFLLITSENSQLQSNQITSLVCVRRADIYAGTRGGGITRFSRGQSKTYTSKNAPLASNDIVAIEKLNNDDIIALCGGETRVCIHNDQFVVLGSYQAK